jgi:hypothetical protein
VAQSQGENGCRKSVTNVRSLEADVLKQVVVELTQLLTRTDALAPPPNGGDDLPDRRQQLDISLATTRHLSRERPSQSKATAATSAARCDQGRGLFQ